MNSIIPSYLEKRRKESSKESTKFNSKGHKDSLIFNSKKQNKEIGEKPVSDGTIVKEVLSNATNDYSHEEKSDILELLNYGSCVSDYKNNNKSKKGSKKSKKKKEESKSNKMSKKEIACMQKEEKKRKKRAEKDTKDFNIQLEEMIAARNGNSGNLMAELMKHSEKIFVVDKSLWLYNEKNGCFSICDKSDVSTKLRSLLDSYNRMKISAREYKEAYEQLLISDEIILEGDFFENQPYVNCLNGVVDVHNKVLLGHSPKFLFKHCIQANYDPNTNCKKFMEYADYITGGDKELKKLLRVIMGYIFSHYNNAKKAILIYGIPHTGKSVLNNVIERIIGKSQVSHVDLAMLQKQEYAASLAGMLLNVAPDLKNVPLKDVGFFKSLVSHDDTISTRALYSNPGSIKGETKMLFSSNHLIEFDKSVDVYDIEAVFNRLLYFPFQNRPITDNEDNKHLSDELYAERDGIFTWAIKGLSKYIDNNENFPESEKSQKIKSKNIARYCSEKVFFNEYLEITDKDTYESSKLIKDLYDEYCKEFNIKKKGNINTYLTEHEALIKKKVRLNSYGKIISSSNPIWAYEGIKIHNKYRT